MKIRRHQLRKKREQLMLKKVYGFLAILVCFPLTAFAEIASEDDEAAIRHVVAEYVAGWREGDVERLSEVFDLDHGHIIWRSGEGNEQTIGSVTFREALENRKSNPGYGEPYRIEHIDIVDGYLAVARFNVERAGKASYIDYFTLYKSNGRWKIVTKAFTHRPGVLLSNE